MYRYGVGRFPTQGPQRDIEIIQTIITQTCNIDSSCIFFKKSHSILNAQHSLSTFFVFFQYFFLTRGVFLSCFPFFLQPVLIDLHYSNKGYMLAHALTWYVWSVSVCLCTFFFSTDIHWDCTCMCALHTSETCLRARLLET